MYKVYRALRNGGDVISEFEEIIDMVQNLKENPNHIYAIKIAKPDEPYESDVLAVTIANYL